MTDANQKASCRRPRFVRATAPPFRVVAGDLQILSLLVRHRFLRSTHIAALCNRSLDKTNDRLLRLFHAGYVNRPMAQRERFPTSGSAPMVYELEPSGLALVRERGITENGGRIFRSRVTSFFIEHELEIADFHAALHTHAACSNVGLITAEELRGRIQEPNGTGRTMFTIQVGVGSEKRSVAPDFVFGIRFPDGSKRCFLTEIDRGTMPIHRTTAGPSCISRKLSTYAEAYATRYYENQFGWKTLRVLIVTTTTARLGAIRAALDKDSKSPAPLKKIFLFGVRKFVRSSPLADVWQDVDGRTLSLV